MPTIVDTNPCLQCKEVIRGRSKRSVFCSKPCNSKYYYLNRGNVEKQKFCIECQSELTSGRITKKFCSKICVSKNWKRNNMTPELKRTYSLNSNYGITVEQWNGMFEVQGRVCSICQAKEPGGRKYWATDHDHATGRVRGVLCSNCNLGLGYFADNYETLISAAAYLLQQTTLLEMENKS